MDERLSLALEQMDKRVQNVLTFLQGVEPGRPSDPAALQEAIHDTANVAANMRALRRLLRRAMPEAGQGLTRPDGGAGAA
ncbi:hypothetical protein [Aureimonas populi]|uniref:Histidine kinase n=1 Tax=Aureimonas populi TaxID=1701758 RepID=A0ABW5CKK9_9HYPH|nr:hypothetical protein [Aureimonas populi]